MVYFMQEGISFMFAIVPKNCDMFLHNSFYFQQANGPASAAMKVHMHFDCIIFNYTLTKISRHIMRRLTIIIIIGG